MTEITEVMFTINIHDKTGQSLVMIALGGENDNTIHI